MNVVITSIPAVLNQYRFSTQSQRDAIDVAIQNALVLSRAPSQEWETTSNVVKKIIPHPSGSAALTLVDNNNHTYNLYSYRAAIAVPQHLEAAFAVDLKVKPATDVAARLYRLLPSTEWNVPLEETARQEMLCGCVAMFPALESMMHVIKDWQYSICISPEIYHSSKNNDAAYLRITMPQSPTHPEVTYHLRQYCYIHSLAKLLYFKALAAHILFRNDLGYFTWASQSVQPTDQRAYFSHWVDAHELNITAPTSDPQQPVHTGCERPLTVSFTDLTDQLEALMGPDCWQGTLDIPDMQQRAAMLVGMLNRAWGYDLQC